MIKVIATILVLMTCNLQYRLWVGEGSYAETDLLQSRVDKMQASMEILGHRNQILRAEITELKSGHDSIEEKARSELGMIKDGETFFLLVDKKDLAQD